MLVCPGCGNENPEGAKFCNGCAAPLVRAVSSREQRKVVTVLFCDVTGSTELGEKLDPETLRALLARYFARMKAIVERHGGTVEKFIGDAVMAVFGVPVVHEDDALRGVRAAVEMREAFPGLGVQGRIGVTTGEVVTGTEERLATGDAVNVAARLEQAAQPGEVLLGKPTLVLIGDAAEIEAVAPLALKGKAEPVAAYRLLRVRDAPERRHEARFVGRELELTVLRAAWERAGVERRCQLVTIVGDAGVGKSRLVAEFLDGLEATVVRGRCLPYGEGITYWPAVEVLKQLGVLPEEGAVAAAIRSLLGETDAQTSAEEIAWAFRKTLEQAAAVRPLVVVFDDIQWGEETFLDLIEHVALLSSGAAILLLCMARPELTERRPVWPSPLRLEPLGDEAVEELIPERIRGELREKITRAAGGNPLFIEEMLAIAQEAKGEVVVPPTLQALLAARLDQLETNERNVLERGAVEGEIFHRGAVQALAPDEPQVTPRLAALVRKQLIRPDKAQLPGEDGFRFRHLLVRDAAYDALPKATRAELHERFAAWLMEHGAELVELDEILGYHLEQAYRYRAELAPVDDEARRLAKRAAERLHAAGARAFARGDMPGAVNLLGRAAGLLPDDDRLALLPDWAAALVEVGELSQADVILGEAIEGARAVGSERLEWRARLRRASAHLWTGEGTFEEALAVAESAAEAFVRLGDELGLAEAWNLVALLRFWGGSTGAAEEAWQHALEHARRAPSPREEAQALTWLLVGTWYGPTPADAGLRRCQEILERSPSRHVEAIAYLELATLEAMRGRFSEARELFRRGKEALEDLGLALYAAGASQELFDIEMLAGDPGAAEAELRAACQTLEQLGEKGFLSTRATCLAHALCAQSRYEEAEPFIEIAVGAGADDDWATQSLWRSARAKVLASRGDIAEALRVAREAVVIVERTDWLNPRAGALADLAEVLRLAGKEEDAAVALREALGLYEQKGNLVSAGKARALLAQLPQASTTA
ncbi:MAG TPA: adenylate/guanylate cyclase domain-containing protein [Gaiellaceae bacterium]|nr:adenylate/guanylate cyclase domain-containing protein [Gaiellaceae bacterium]